MSFKPIEHTNLHKNLESPSKIEDIMLNKQNMPIKMMIMDIEHSIADVKRGINRNNKRKNEVNEELKSVELNASTKLKSISYLIKEDITNFIKDLEQLKEFEIEQNMYIDEQLKYLNNDNQILSQKLSSIDDHITRYEDSVGMDFYK